MKLNKVNCPKGHNTYCGPAVISALTGATTNEAAAVIRHHSGQRAVRGSATRHVLKSLESYGITAKPAPAGNRLTLAGWLREFKAERTAGRVFLVVAGDHFQLISGRKYVCGRIGDVVSIKHDAVKRRARVASVHELTPGQSPGTLRGDALKAVEAASTQKAQTARNGNLLAKLKREAAALGVDVDVCRESGEAKYWLSPNATWHTDPIDDGHYAYDADDFDSVLQHYRDAQHTHRTAQK